ncbi:MAG: efflux RND transporter periplasmic adaptor subunit [bacterium]
MTKNKKIIIGVVIVLAIGGYFGVTALIKKPGQTSYVLAQVERGTLITSISGSGQVSSANQVDVKAKVSGDVLAVLFKKGQEVGAGAILARVDSADAQKAVRDAQVNLETAQLSLQKLTAPVDSLSLLQAENSLTQANNSLKNTQDSLVKSYEDGYNVVTSAFLDLPTIMVGLGDILLGNSFSSNQQNIDYYTDNARTSDLKAMDYRDTARASYLAARTAYDKNFSDYKLASRNSQNSEIENLINETYETVKKISDAVKNANNLIQFYQDNFTGKGFTPASLSNTHLASLNSYISKTNSMLSSLASVRNSIESSQQAIPQAEITIKEKAQALEDLKDGADPLDIRSSQINVEQKSNTVLDAEAKLADYTIRAPFAGQLADVAVSSGDSISSGATVATLITKQKIAEISLNEVDIAKVKVGQKAIVTFDAIDGLEITGQVGDLDTLGTVSQGVVSYNVKIVFDTQDDRVKPGMSVSVSIITNVKQDVLMAPNSAIKMQNDTNYVEIMSATTSAPIQREVVIGIADDSFTEIISGVSLGERVVTKTIESSTKSTTQTATGNILNVGGGGRFR